MVTTQAIKSSERLIKEKFKQHIRKTEAKDRTHAHHSEQHVFLSFLNWLQQDKGKIFSIDLK